MELRAIEVQAPSPSLSDLYGTTLLSLLASGNRPEVLERRKRFYNPPPFFLGIQAGPTRLSRSLIDELCFFMAKYDREGQSPWFHGETGVICDSLTWVALEATDKQALRVFVDRYLDFMQGKRKTFPRHIKAASMLHDCSLCSYGTDLQALYGRGGSLPTQDFAILFRVPREDLIVALMDVESPHEIFYLVKKYRS